MEDSLIVRQQMGQTGKLRDKKEDKYIKQYNSQIVPGQNIKVQSFEEFFTNDLPQAQFVQQSFESGRKPVTENEKRILNDNMYYLLEGTGNRNSDRNIKLNNKENMGKPEVRAPDGNFIRP